MDWMRVDGDRPADRRRTLAAMNDDALADWLVAQVLDLRADEGLHDAVVRAANLPAGEALASPFGWKAVCLGVEAGATTFHRELRCNWEWPDEMRGSAAVRDEAHAVWERGVLKSGKYQGFCAEEPFAIYDPSYGAKWGPHELLHRAVGFFFRPNMTRWELYLGARLNELLPVVLFYGPDQVLRLNESDFRRESAPLTATLEEARWLYDDEAALRVRALSTLPQLRAGLAHFERELQAIDDELARGLRVRVADPLLDASSDATAYVAGHFNMLAAQPVVSVLNAVPAGVRFSEIHAYRAQVEHMFDRLLFARVGFDESSHLARRSGRALWDLLLRTAQLGLDQGFLMTMAEERAAGALAAAFEGQPIDVAVWRRETLSELTPEHAEWVSFDGSEGGSDMDQLTRGMESVAPLTAALLDDETLHGFGASDSLWQRKPLVTRLQDFLAHAEVAEPFTELCRLEGLIARVGRDDAVERLCAPPESLPQDLSSVEIVRNRAFEMVEFEYEVVHFHAQLSAEGEAEMPAASPRAWLVGGYFDEVSILPVTSGVSALWRSLTDEVLPASVACEILEDDDSRLPGWPTNGEQWLRELLVSGALGWRPGAF